LHSLGPWRRLAVVTCHACGREFPLGAGVRVGFRDTCDDCGVDLHVCLGCAHHDEGAYNECAEPSAERVLDKERANRCDYFTPAARAAGHEADQAKARAEIERLFKK
jgi:hypothetical protein